jgi:hypothetical protein
MPKPVPTVAKRQPLTLAQIAAYDDILTDALVDHVRSPDHLRIGYRMENYEP